jgi:hypothetical protein
LGATEVHWTNDHRTRTTSSSPTLRATASVSWTPARGPRAGDSLPTTAPNSHQASDMERKVKGRGPAMGCPLGLEQRCVRSSDGGSD